MLATALSLGLVGLDAYPVRVEVEAGRGPAFFQMVGLAEASVREARVRIRSALRALSVDIDEHVLTVSLSPADTRKCGSAFDLAMAAAVLVALGRAPERGLEATLLLGELSLSGELRPVRGVLPSLVAAKRLGIRRAIVPLGNGGEAAVVAGLEVAVASSLAEVAAHLRGEGELGPAARAPACGSPPVVAEADLCEVRGQPAAKRALEIAAAGGHNLLMMGPPGAGKTMLARRLPGILPPFTADEALETSAIHSVAGLLQSGVGLLSERPFRAPHHTASAAALAGGGVPIRPGEVALAHHGCLFLDELLEFQRSAIEALRQPLEDAVVTICRARERAVYPARVMLVAAVNPCPCGYAGSPRCGCSSDRVQSYRSRLSGPLLDRIDIHLALPAARVRDLHGAESGESSAAVRARVVEARERANRRAALLGIAPRPNAALSPRELRRVAVLGPAAERLLSDASERLGLSARAHGKVLRLARTIADLAAAPEIAPPHVAEAVQLRVLDRALSPVSAAVSAQQSVPEA